MSGRRTAAALLTAGVLVFAPVGGVVALAAVTPPPTPPPAAAGSSCAAAGQGATLIASAAKGTPWPADQLVTAVAIAIAESNGVPTATNNNTNGSTDYGLWQINSIHTDVLSAGDWKDPAANAHMAFVIWQQAGSWQPWSTYNSGAYQSHIAEATAAVAGTPAPACTTPPPAAGGPIGPTSPAAATIIAAARSVLGVPYTWGGASEATGFDCSGLTMWAYAQAGIALPHNAAAQEAMSRSTSTPRPGDLVFFDGPPAGHVAIYLGGGQMLAAPHTGDVVKIQPVYGGARYGAILP